MSDIMCKRFVRAFFLLNCTQSVCIDEIASLRLLPDFSVTIIRRLSIAHFNTAREKFSEKHQICQTLI